MGFAGTVEAGAQIDNGLTPEQKAKRAKRQPTLDLIEAARKELQSGAASNCMSLLKDAMNRLSNDYKIDRY